MSEENGDKELPVREVDYKYRRCFLDRQGNVIDPRTSWDRLLKYYRKYWNLLGVGRKSREFSESTALGALKLIVAEKRHEENKKKASLWERRDLKRKEKERRKEKRKKIRKQGTNYLKWAHEEH